MTSPKTTTMRHLFMLSAVVAGVSLIASLPTTSHAAEPRIYENTLSPIANPQPLLADHPDFVQAVSEPARFEAPALIDEDGADLEVRAWRFSYNARGVIEIPNRLRGDRTAVIVVHPWGIDDSNGWTTPEPAGVAFFCTPEKNRICQEHVRAVLNPFLKSLRPRVADVMYSLPGQEDPIRRLVYRSLHGDTTLAARSGGERELHRALANFDYRGEPIPAKIELMTENHAVEYFAQFPGLDACDKYNNAGFWKQPIPVMEAVDVDLGDIVIYDGEGYDVLRDGLKQRGIRHVLLAGYATDMCVCATTAGYDNLRKDFNVFLVGDATMATFPASPSPAAATTSALCLASMKVLVTQVSWIKPLASAEKP